MILSTFAFAALSSIIQSVSAVDITNVTTVDIEIVPAHLSLVGDAAPVVQRVSYFIDNGVAIMDGDIAFATEEQLLAHTTSRKRAISINPQFLWPNGTIKFKWETQEGKDGREEMWLNATRRWTSMLPFLKFEDVGAINSTLVNDVVTLRATKGQKICVSPNGMATDWGFNYIQLDDDCGGVGTYAHEIGHTLGLLHEQVRPDRDSYIKINCENVMDDAFGNPADCGQNCTGLGCNFQIWPQADYSGAYDTQSIMHYGSTEFSKNGKPVIETLPDVPEPKAHAFPDALDARRVCDLYREQCTGVCGDGILAPGNGEECDDGNNVDGDGCSADCKNEGTGSGQPAQGNSANSSSCPLRTCDPNAASNGCDFTTSCTRIEGGTQGGDGQYMCACRHGFRASGSAASDTSIQVRLPWEGQEGRVFVSPGVRCNRVCDNWSLAASKCREVTVEDVCF